MTEEIPNPKTSRLEPLSVLWHILIAPQTLLVLMGSIALALALGTLIPQVPQQLGGDPQSWLAVQSDIPGYRNDLVRTLGLFDLYQTLWFRLLLVLTGLVLFVWAVELADLARHATRRKNWTIGALALWARHAARIRLSSSLPPQDAQARIRDFLALHGYGCADVTAPPNPSLIAGRRKAALWARPLAHGALILALIGLFIVSTWGWQNEDWQPIPGDSRAVGHGSPYAVRLDAFHLQLGNNGQLCDCRSEVTWLEGDSVVRRDAAGIGESAALQGVAVRQIGYVPIVKVRAWDATGRPLTIQTTGEESGPHGELEIVFPSAQAQPHIFIPSHDLFLTLAFEPLCTTGRPGLHLVLLQAGGTERQPLGILYESGLVHFDDVSVNFDLAYGPILRVDYRPAMGLVVISLVIAVVALAAGWIASPELMWIAVEPDGEDAGVVQILAMPGTGSSLWLPRLASRLRKVLTDGT
jgi:hypothetical protein